MTVDELIAALQQVEDKSLPVELEGCDCYGDADHVTVGAGFVTIDRPES